jgi:hypothetical protein
MQMRNGTVLKSGALPDTDALNKINQYTRRPFSAEEVYTFRVALCDNEIDRDYERFTTEALSDLGKLFLGKTGIFNHSMDASTQVARIYDTALETDQSRKTMAGEPYCRLVAMAYLPRCDKNRDLMLEIDSGMKKEVSVGCSVGSMTCSICGTDLREKSCGHQKGQLYNGKVCCAVLSNPQDAYEWSFVAVPAQREAGVTKGFKNSGMEDDVAWGKRYRQKLMKETVKAISLLHPEIKGDTVRRMALALSPEELEQVEDSLQKNLQEKLPLAPQLMRREKKAQKNDNEPYCI